MTQFNLLPDIKLEYERTKRIQRLMTLISIVVTVAALVIVAFLGIFVGVVQANNIKTLNNEIQKDSTNLVGKKNLNQILTIQNQLESLTSLHNQKPAATRLFSYLTELTPVNANITKLTVDFDKKTIEVTGTADTFKTLNQFVDTLKLTKYNISGLKNSTKLAFSNVVLSQFNVVNVASSGSTTTPGPGGVTYTIDFDYDPNLFDITKTVNIIIPNEVVNRPSALFVDVPKNTTTSTTSTGN